MTLEGGSPRIEFTPKLVRAARALLAWSQQELAKAAGVATSTVADFERGHRIPLASNAKAIQGALEKAGIQFLPNGAVIGPALPEMSRSTTRGMPVRWVSETDLSSWADSIDGATNLPTLLANLIRAIDGSACLRFPSDEGTRHPGWDGRTTSENGSTYVPKGEAGWEMSAQREGVPAKATKDYEKRTEDPAPLDPASATFVFVTLRSWADKDKWADEKKRSGAWRDVRVYDVTDLVHWIEQTPAVGLWLATRLNKRPPGTRELEEVWEEWSRATQLPLPTDLVLADRDQDAAEVLRWLRGKPSVFNLQSTTTDEVVAFFHATLGELPDDRTKDYRARCLVVTTAEAARALAGATPPLILVLTAPDPGLAQRLADRGHLLLQAYDDRPTTRGNVRVLPRPSRESVTSALTIAGYSGPRVEGIARDCACNLAILRRRIPAAPDHQRPPWADDPNRALLAALLVGGWDENAPNDTDLLASIAEDKYETIVAALKDYEGEFDRPLQKVGSHWRVTSPYDAWFLLAGKLTAGDLGRFESAALAVLGSKDPRFDLPPDERWMASVRGVRPAYSEGLRHGIGQVLILLALWGEEVRLVPDAGRRADAIVRRLLGDADKSRWWALKGELRLLAEAAPRVFLTAIEDSLEQDSPPIAVLFEQEKGAVFETEHLSELLWALETLAWSPEWLPQVTLILARLDAMDTKQSRHLNRPANSLREIYLLWSPQTFATLDERLSVLDLIRKKETNTAWKLMLGILPKGYDHSTPTPKPRWRDFSVEKVEMVTRSLIWRGADAITKRLLDDVGLDPVRWSDLFERLGDLSPDPDVALARLEAAESHIVDKADRATFWKQLGGVLNKHRQYPDAEWALKESVLGRLEAVYDRFAPEDPLEQVAWLFQQSVPLPKPTTVGWESAQREVVDARKQAAKEVYTTGGATMIFELARLSEAAGYIGKALYDSGLPDSDIHSLIEAGLRSVDEGDRSLARGLIATVSYDRKEPWSSALIAKAKADKWGDAALLAILLALPSGRWTWNEVARIGGELETTYWRQTQVFRAGEKSEDLAYAIRKLIEVGRARYTLELAAPSKLVNLASDVLIEVLRKAARQPVDNSEASGDAGMFQYYVAEIFQLLDQREDVDPDDLVALEWTYLPILEHSPRPAKALFRALSEQPHFFMEVLQAAYKPSKESGVVDPEPEDPELVRAVARQAYQLLNSWDRLPGTREEGTIDIEALKGWIVKARDLAKAVGRAEVADDRIGNMLSASPMGMDGNWPAEPVREVLDHFRSDRMMEGFRIGKFNRRGTTTRGLRDGGQQERDLATEFRKWAKALCLEHRRTAKALDTLADGYERDARWQDEKAKRVDWEG